MKHKRNCFQIALERCKNLPYYLSVIHYVFGNHPSIFFPLYIWREGDCGNVVRRNTRLVIEGYPRSANTFAEAAFKISQPRAVKTADHIHVPSQIIRGARYGIPICLLIRNPEDVVRSLVVKHTKILVPDALRGYENFYNTCWTYRKAFLVATYEQVTADFGMVIRKINRCFGTHFVPFEHSDNNVRHVFDILDERNMRINNGETCMSYRPNRHKEIQKKTLLLTPYRDNLLHRCNVLYRQYQQLSGQEHAGS